MNFHTDLQTKYNLVVQPDASSRRVAKHFSVRGIVFIFGLLLFGPFLVKGITSRAYAAESRAMATNEDLISPAYETALEKTSDVSKLTRVGQGLMTLGFYKYAALNFKRASDVDPNFRDASYAWAYCILKDKHSALTPQDLSQVHLAINRAEAVDPLYLPLLKLKIAVAELEKDQSTLDATHARLSLLEPK